MSTAADPFTRACPAYRNAMRHCARTGEAFEVTARGLWRDLLSLLVLVGFGFVFLTLTALAASYWHGG